MESGKNGWRTMRLRWRDERASFLSASLSHLDRRRRGRDVGRLVRGGRDLAEGDLDLWMEDGERDEMGGAGRSARPLFSTLFRAFLGGGKAGIAPPAVAAASVRGRVGRAWARPRRARADRARCIRGVRIWSEER